MKRYMYMYISLNIVAVAVYVAAYSAITAFDERPENPV